MITKPIRTLVVVTDPEVGSVRSAKLDQNENFEVVGLVHNQRAAVQLADTTQPEVMLIDLMLPGYRSIDVME